MDLNPYAVEILARDQLATLRRAAARQALIRTAARPRPVIRVMVGLALLRLGARALGSEHARLATRA